MAWERFNPLISGADRATKPVVDSQVWYSEAVSIPSLAGQTARPHSVVRTGEKVDGYVSIPSLAGQTARLDGKVVWRIKNEQDVSIPSLAGQTARQYLNSLDVSRESSGFNPLISGADRATKWCCVGPCQLVCTWFQSPH